tara:strand:+ start:1159 stop:1536 length:378 start_codon:yes stop_codon:yes gene_type:complete
MEELKQKIVILSKSQLTMVFRGPHLIPPKHYCGMNNGPFEHPVDPSRVLWWTKLSPLLTFFFQLCPCSHSAELGMGIQKLDLFRKAVFRKGVIGILQSDKLPFCLLNQLISDGTGSDIFGKVKTA